ncbi:unnamed protein product [marine sediment metagenome]|uniref:Uncharacterized protein n=1 Tax=marine sediment metagenome TaxID=412755 RepID=X1GY08_9ZZZZ
MKAIELIEGAKEILHLSPWRSIEKLNQAIAELEKQPDLMKALKLAYEAMNYLGDILNNHDMVQPEDEAVTKEAFEVVSKIVGKSKP